MLWFDVESRYKATSHAFRSSHPSLWFDVESRYEATVNAEGIAELGCGLM